MKPAPAMWRIRLSISPRLGLRRQRNRPRAAESEREPSEHHEVSVESDALQSADPKRSQSVLMLQPPELALDGSTTPVEVAPALRLARDQRVESRRLAPQGLG